MTYYGGQELAASFRTVRNNTLQIAEDIPESSYSFKAAEDCRSIGRTLAHIGTTTMFQSYVHQNRLDSLAKVNFPELMQKMAAEEADPRTKTEIIAFVKVAGEKCAQYLEGLSDGVLAEPVGMPPGAQPATKSRFEMLLGVKEHEMHHRGQLMVMQRMLGLTPHLTRQMQERMAAQQQAQPART